MTRTEYSRLRKQAQQRIKRLEAAGFTKNPTFKTLRELESDRDIVKEADRITKWLDKPTSTVKGARQAEEERKAKRREQSKRYREEKKAIEEQLKKEKIEPPKSIKEARAILALTKDQRSLIKSARTLGIKLSPEEVVRFAEYLSYRYAQTKASEYYFFDTWLNEFMMLEESKVDLADLVEDFEAYKADADEWDAEALDGLGGYTSEQLDDTISELIKKYAKKDKS